MAGGKKTKEPAFEDALRRLEAIVRSLEEGDRPLEESLRLFEEGVGLTRLCSARLVEAQRKIDLLTRTAEGELKLVPFESADAATGDEGPDEP